MPKLENSKLHAQRLAFFEVFLSFFWTFFLSFFLSFFWTFFFFSFSFAAAALFASEAMPLSHNWLYLRGWIF